MVYGLDSQTLSLLNVGRLPLWPPTNQLRGPLGDNPSSGEPYKGELAIWDSRSVRREVRTGTQPALSTPIFTFRKIKVEVKKTK